MPIIRLLLAILLISVIYFIIRLIINPKRQISTPQKNQTKQNPESMVQCATCHIHLPKSQAIYAKEHWFCSQAHQNDFNPNEN